MLREGMRSAKSSGHIPAPLLELGKHPDNVICTRDEDPWSPWRQEAFGGRASVRMRCHRRPCDGQVQVRTKLLLLKTRVGTNGVAKYDEEALLILRSGAI